MYLVPIIALAIVIAIGAAWSPIFALIVALPLFLLFLAWVGLRRRADQETSADSAPTSEESAKEKPGGIWGEKGA